MSVLLDQATLALTRQLSATMRAQCEHSFELFCRYYLNEYFELPPSEMHKTMFGLLQGASIARNSRIALAAPRGHAKSTLVSQGYVLCPCSMPRSRSCSWSPPPRRWRCACWRR